MKLVFCITTYNRLRYLRECIETFLKTKNSNHEWTLIIADDGSNDGTINYLKKLFIENIPVIVIFNRKTHITRQTNSLFEVCNYLNFDFGFKVDDDVLFKESGWDDKYIEAWQKYNYDHLVYHNQKCKWGKLKDDKGDIISYMNANDSLGCFFTFTPKVFEKVGFFDEEKFKGPGYSHIEFTIRCCRAGFNNGGKLYDIKNSNKYIYIRCPALEPSYWSVKTTSHNPENERYKNYVLRNKNIIHKEHEEKSKNILINCKNMNENYFKNNNIFENNNVEIRN